MAVGAVVARILTQYSDKGSKAAQRDIKRFGKDVDAMAKKVTKAFALAAAASAAFAVKVGKDAVKAAVEDSKSQALLANTLKNTLGITGANIAAVEQYIEKQQALSNIQDTELRASFSALAVALGNTNDAMLVQTVAMDVAAGTGKDLSAVTQAIVRATQGNFTALRRLIPTLDESIVKNKDLGAALTFLSNTYKGSAEELAKQDPITSLQIAFGELSEKLGFILLPTFMRFADFIKTRVIPELEYYLFLNETRLVNAFESVFRGLKDLANTFQQIYNVIGAINSIVPLGLGTWIKLGVAISVAGNAAVLFLNAAKRFRELKTMYTMVRGSEQGFKLLKEEMGGATTAAQFLGGKLADLRNWIVLTTPGKFVIAQFVALQTALLSAAAAGNAFAAALLVVYTRIKQLMTFLLKTGLGRLILAIAAVGTAIAKLNQKDKITISDQAREAEFSMYMAAKSTESMDHALNKYRETQDSVVKKTKEQIEAERRLRALQAKADADAKKRAKFEADYQKINARIAKTHGVKLLSSEEEKLVQINAAEALLDRQQKLDDLNKKRLKDLKDEILSLKVRNDLAQRYDDILKVIADNEITSKEIDILAKKWEIPRIAVEAYLASLFSVEDAKISDDEIINLAKKWGSTQEQAARYLDFFNYLNDGVLDDSEIQKLMTKWKMTEDQVRMYADFVGIVNDGKLTDAEIVKIKDKWKLTTDQVVDYIKYIGSPVSYSGTLIDPAKAAEIAWLNATAALQRYLDLLKRGQGVIIPGTPTVPNVPVVPTVPNVPIVPPSHDSKIISDAAAAAEKIADQIATLTELRKDTTPGTGINFLLKEHIDALKENTSTVSNLPIVDEQTKLRDMGFFDSPIPSNFDVGSFRMAEEASMAGLPSTPSFNDYDERFRFQAFNQNSTVNTARGISGGNLMAAPVINITVEGSVTAEQDLVQTVRNGLLAAQYNGNSLLLEAI